MRSYSGTVYNGHFIKDYENFYPLAAILLSEVRAYATRPVGINAFVFIVNHIFSLFRPVGKGGSGGSEEPLFSKKVHIFSKKVYIFSKKVHSFSRKVHSFSIKVQNFIILVPESLKYHQI